MEARVAEGGRDDNPAARPLQAGVAEQPEQSRCPLHLTLRSVPPARAGQGIWPRLEGFQFVPEKLIRDKPLWMEMDGGGERISGKKLLGNLSSSFYSSVCPWNGG